MKNLVGGWVLEIVARFGYVPSWQGSERMS